MEGLNGNGLLRWLSVRGARQNNLKSVDAHFPLGRFICVTGVSGSGKSSLVVDILREELSGRLNDAENARPGEYDAIDGLEHLDKVIDIDQKPIGRTPRSNPATYVKVFDQIRDLYAKLPDAKVRGYMPGRFSFNVAAGKKGGGRCEACEGNGANRMDMEFLADVWVMCPVCGGHRFSRETLQVLFRGKSIADVLEMDVQQALEHFRNIPRIAEMLETLHRVGLDYIKLGQPAPTLSGGEAQRIKLARELVRRSTGRTLYILDEPTTGLHFDDIRKLLEVLHGFVDGGNTVVVIEHNLDVIKTADWVIDLGPEGGEAGGYIVVAGTPEDVASCKASYTGQALRAVLD
ncbi:MAG TPA: ATP-binding cassette domain-containing protein, partial [Phycisphaerae bacterium]|nr:ATP-binding cassette domain-containing protein [Phycisphaerae bacterium]